MKKSITSLIGRAGLVLAMGVLAGADAHARHLEPAKALSILNAGAQKSSSANPLKLAYTQKAESGEDAVYVFNHESAAGFYVLAADDAVGDIVLGYSHSGSFSQEDMSPGFRWLLDAYSQCVSESAAGGSPMLHAMRVNRNNISPMITTTWDQKSPFNNDCPTLSGNNCATGCVATAMAQVLNYHKYPTKGNGLHSYTWNGTTLSFDYGSTTFDWANMLDNYSGSSNYSQKTAVAKLMYACGVGVDMNYSLRESSATDVRIPYALTKFFNYDKATRYLKRAFFNYYEWDELIYSEISASRPVIYSGQALGGGHEFICDGYENGYFHINWGWGGLGDGHFLLTNLDPQVSGTGGVQGGYNYDQTAVVGIQPAVAGSTPWYPIYAGGGISATVFNNGKDAKIFNQGGVYNYSPEAVGIDFILKAVSSTGNEYRGAARHLDFNGMSPNPSGYGGFNLSLPANLANGTYKVYLEFKTPEGNIQPVLFPVTAAAYFNLTVNGKNVTITDGEPEAKATIRVTEFSPVSEVTTGKPAKFIVKIDNIGDIDYSGTITAKLYRYGENTCLTETGINIGTLAAGLSLEGSVNLTLNYPDGKYIFRIHDMYDDLVSGDFDFWIGENHDGIEAIPTDYSNADIYTVSGLLIKKDATPADVNSLGHGIYILVINGKAYKIKA